MKKKKKKVRCSTAKAADVKVKKKVLSLLSLFLFSSLEVLINRHICTAVCVCWLCCALCWLGRLLLGTAGKDGHLLLPVIRALPSSSLTSFSSSSFSPANSLGNSSFQHLCSFVGNDGSASLCIHTVPVLHIVIFLALLFCFSKNSHTVVFCCERAALKH